MDIDWIKRQSPDLSVSFPQHSVDEKELLLPEKKKYLPRVAMQTKIEPEMKFKDPFGLGTPPDITIELIISMRMEQK